jgi:glycosyltransferase involved in cell wall biosynthesis
MLGHGLGGVQTAFVGYTKLLRHLGHEVICCVSPGARIAAHLPTETNVIRLHNYFERDPIAALRAAWQLRSIKLDLVMVHGRRAFMVMSLARRLAGRAVPLVNVLHRYRLKYVSGADLILCVSRHLREEAAAHGIDPAKLAHVPNFLTGSFDAQPPVPWNDPPVVGFLGRMVPEKGLDLLIEALAILKEAGVRFTARIGGDGDLKARMIELATARGLGPQVQWLGWVEDPGEFHSAIDVLCVPSRWESFGLVILDAFKAGKPVVATRTGGPSGMILDKINGLLCDIDARDVAAKLKVVLENPDFGQRLAAQAGTDVLDYNMDAVAPKVEALLAGVVQAFSRPASARVPVAASGAVD